MDFSFARAEPEAAAVEKESSSTATALACLATTFGNAKRDLGLLDVNLDANLIRRDLGTLQLPQGLLSWLAKPSLRLLLDAAFGHAESEPTEDPRIGWFVS